MSGRPIELIRFSCVSNTRNMSSISPDPIMKAMKIASPFFDRAEQSKMGKTSCSARRRHVGDKSRYYRFVGMLQPSTGYETRRLLSLISFSDGNEPDI